jgi:hypothetical protein
LVFPLLECDGSSSYSSSCAFLPAKELSVSASESGDESERTHKRHKRHQRSRSPGNTTERDSKRHKRKRKHKQQKDEGHSPSRSGKDEPVGERKETEEEYDARLEREEKERLAAERKRELERLSRQREQEASSTNGVRFKGMFYPLFLRLSLMILHHLRRTGKNEVRRPRITQETITIQFVLWSLFHIYLAL